MESKKYSSFVEINKELEILKLEKEIYSRKLLLSFDNTKESLAPSNIASSMVSSVTRGFNFNSIGSILKLSMPLLVTWFVKKRGF